jgi:hypothetical protein
MERVWIKDDAENVLYHAATLEQRQRASKAWKTPVLPSNTLMHDTNVHRSQKKSVSGASGWRKRQIIRTNRKGDYERTPQGPAQKNVCMIIQHLDCDNFGGKCESARA